MDRLMVEWDLLRRKGLALAALVGIGIVFEVVWGGGCDVVGR